MRFDRPTQPTDGADFTIVVADDHPAARRALTELLNREPGVQVIAQAASTDQALHAVAATRPDLLVLDWNMPGLHGIHALQQIRAAHPELAVISFSMNDPRIYETPALTAGATAYVSKDQPLTLLARIREAMILGARHPEAAMQ